MRVVGLLCFLALAGFALGFVSAGPAAAQGSGSDVGGGSSAILTRSEGTTSPPRMVVPAAFGELRMSLRLAYARFGSPSWLRTQWLVLADPAADHAYALTRRRVAR